MSVVKRIDDVMSDKKISTRVALLEQMTNHTNQYFDKIDRRFDVLEKKCDKIEDGMYESLRRIESKIDNSFRWLITVSISIFFSAASLGFTVYQVFKN